ncbi:MAG TPA: c-type cytochrome [Eoetvoesiella sp.]|uniref:c-type cytochrome n=1 Tax=Eoetvoesiella sp. TaxID=1966355 RepID=UPI002C9BD731|nr:c-type cytochrome [Eoetvoesiella sp.]HWK60753.1 c-type cytochrome [Eoetvoesiella sp.]
MTAPDHPTSLSAIGSRDLSPPPASMLLHGAVLRPPALLWDGRRYTGAGLDNLDAASARQVPGVADIVVIGNFIGVIASQASQAVHARNQIQAHWVEAAPAASEPAAAPKRIAHSEPPDAAAPGNAPDSATFSRRYAWPAQHDAARAWAIAHYTDGKLTVWTACGQPGQLGEEIAALCDLDAEAVLVISNGQASVDGYDAAVDAALLTRWCARPVRIQAEDAAIGSAQPLELEIRVAAQSATPAADSLPSSEAPLSPEGRYVTTANRYATRRPSIAALLCGYEYDSQPTGITVATSYYAAGATQVTSPANAPISATPDAGQSAARIFACESFFDELSHAQNRDAVQARLDSMRDPTGRDLIQAVADRADWRNAPKPQDGVLAGKGFAYAHIVDNDQEPPRQTWSAWVAEVSVDRATGAVDVTRLTVGHNTEALREDPGSAERLEDRVRDTASRLLRGSQGFDTWGTADEPAANPGYALVQPKVELVAQGQGGELNTELGWSRHAELPAAAAIANAIYSATGVRFRQPPFDTETLRTRLARTTSSYKKLAYALLGGVAATVAGLVVSAMPWRSAMAPLANVDTSIYSQAAINRGKLVAAAGDCMVCHTAENGRPNVGGRPLETPFGTVYTTNITPDKKTGIGTWSYAAFERAMRQGIHQDGHLLYPAFPYTAFARISDTDMQALYAYLMTQEPVEYAPPKTRLAFPFSLRPMLAGWNLLFHREQQAYKPVADQSMLWNRGAYLVQGAGHCAACHSPRNALGAEKGGAENFLGGGFADGWEAPALNALSKAPIGWTEDSLYDYLRNGYSSLHGVAAGPMGPVIHSMSELPDSDVRAIAHYLSSLNPPAQAAESPAMRAARLEDASRNNPLAMTHPGENLFEGACAVCHDARGGPPLFGSRPSLALNSNLHSDSPDNVIQVLLHGIDDPAVSGLGNMPGFGASMNDQQLETLISYLRLRFAPDKAAWGGLGEKIRAIRDAGH